ncbi:MAG: hypothetical protein AAFY71_25765 [Bacteroidota bacterium]
MTRILTTLFLVGAFSLLQAQNCKSSVATAWANKSRSVITITKAENCKKDRLHFQLGAAGNYLYDSNTETGFSPQPERINPMGEALLGLRFDHKGRRANVIGAFANAGYQSAESVAILLQEQGDTREIDPMATSNRFYELEGGLLFREWFRISGGVGTQEFTTMSGEAVQLDYFKVTTGLSIRLTRSIKWNTNASFLFTEGANTYTFRPSTGLAFRFNFLKA